jgi:hypothetical protein
MELMRALFRSVLDEDTTGPIPQVEQALQSATVPDWRLAMHYMRWHRILPLCAASLTRRGLDQYVHFEMRPTLRRELALTEYANNARMTEYGQLVKDLRGHGVEPVLLKSAALVALLHPRLDGHGMCDVDFLVPPESAQTIARIIVDKGYTQVPADEDSNTYIHPGGLLLLDYHFRFRLYDRFKLDELLEDVPSVHPALDTVRIFEPNATLVHLSVHLNEHRCDLGYGIRWLFDIGMLLQHARDRFDIDRIRRLVPTRLAYGQLLRLVAFFEKEIGIPMPPALRPHIEHVQPFTVAETMRSNRLAAWPLWTVRGWAKLGACTAGLLPQEERMLPRFGDSFKGIAESLRERRALRAIEQQTPAPAPGVQHAAVSS